MKTVVVDDDLYQFLLKNTQEIGESASSIIRRLVGMSPEVGKPVSQLAETFDFLRMPEAYQHRSNVDRFLFLLSWAYRKDPPAFEQVIVIEGRKRKYFSTDPKQLLESGSSVNPRQIPDSPYWVITNNSTAKKFEMLSDVLRVLGYPREEVSSMLRMFLKW